MHSSVLAYFHLRALSLGVGVGRRFLCLCGAGWLSVGGRSGFGVRLDWAEAQRLKFCDGEARGKNAIPAYLKPEQMELLPDLDAKLGSFAVEKLAVKRRAKARNKLFNSFLVRA